MTLSTIRLHIPDVGMPRFGARMPALVQFASFLLLMPLALAGLLALSSAPAHADRLDCKGYPEKRQFVDAQSWWRTTPGKTGTDFGHAHMGGCIPERQQHSETIALDVRVILHANPGKVAEAVLVTKTTSTETTQIHDKSIAGFTCPIGTCETWLRWNVPLSWFDHSGLQEIRYRVYIDEPDGNRMIVSLNYQTYINNGKPLDDVTRNAYLRGKGWYTGAGYCEASLRQPLPDHSVGDAYSPLVAMVNHGTADDRAVTHAIVLRDADFHNGIPGTTLVEANGQWGPKRVHAGYQTESGRHRLLIKSDCDDPRGSTNSGVLVYTFYAN